jgi:RND family efflux transporter MFP subunit
MSTTTTPTRHAAPVTMRTAGKRVTTPAEPALAEPAPAEPSRRGLQKSTAVVAIVILFGLASVFALGSYSSDVSSTSEMFVLHTVDYSDLPITITERGTIESQNNIEIACEVDDIQGDGINGNPILWIVENGSSVKKGDLLVEIDSSSHLERFDEQILDEERARTRKVQAEIAYENRKSKNETNLAKAQLNVELAELALEQYQDEDGGTFQIDLQEIDLAIQEQQAKQVIDDTNLEAIEELYSLGYKSKGDLAEARLNALKSDSALSREMSRRTEFVRYTHRKMRLQLEGRLNSARRALLQIERDNAALLAQAESSRDSATRAWEKEVERLERYEEQLQKCKIYAPQDGMVAYHINRSRWGGSTSIAQGVAVRDRQPLLTLPDLKHMQVKTSVHESVVDQVRAGQRATVRMDAFPEKVYEATVESVGVLPDPGGWLSSDTKVYETVITIDKQVEGLKPGMTAVVEVHLDYLTDVLCIPVQALIQRTDQTWCYVNAGGRIEQRFVDQGRSNDKFVEIRSGLSRGDVVILNPSAVLEQMPELEQLAMEQAEIEQAAASSDVSE